MDKKFILRPLAEYDFGDIQQIAAENWEGQDYLPRAFPQWVADPGLLIGIEESHAHQIVALAHVALLPDGTAWLEGLRVRTDFRNLGLSRIIMTRQMEYSLDLLKKGTINRIASTTYIKNEASIHLSLSWGFKIAGSYLILSWNPIGKMEESIEVKPWIPTWEEIRLLPYFQDSNQLVIEFFKVEQLNENWWNATKKELSFFQVNGARGWLDERVEPHCVILEPSVDSIIHWLHFAYFRLGQEASTVIYPKGPLVEELKKTNLISWTDWTPDCLYFVYDPTEKK